MLYASPDIIDVIVLDDGLITMMYSEQGGKDYKTTQPTRDREGTRNACFAQ
jgi:hypothetical protein